MARGAKGRRGGGRGGGGGARPRASGREEPSGIEKYGKDEADEFLGLDDDDAMSEAAPSSQGPDEEVFAPDEDWGDEDEADDKAEEKGSFKKALKKKAGTNEEDEGDRVAAVKEAAGAGSVGWKGRDFYGGDDAGGDSSDGGSEEELNFQEAKRLEELRAQRLGGLAVSNPLALLLGPDAGADASGSQATAEAAGVAGGAASSSAAASARFESVFEAAAEKGTVPKDLSQLSEAKKRSLIKKEAPELLPLLEDFQVKLAGLLELLPLLKPEALRRTSTSGAQYLQAKAGLLLNTLANLSFYVLLRAEGGDVRTHPVVSQLVWLKELHDKAAPLDDRLRPSLRKALKAVKKAEKEEAEAAKASNASKADAKEDDEAEDEAAAVEPKLKLSLREKLERLRAVAPPAPKGAAAAGAAAARGGVTARSAEPRTADLLRLPGRRRKDGGSRGAPADLDEVDPLMGQWMPTSTLGEQLTSVRQYVSDGLAKAKVASADQDVEARPRRARERVREEPLPGPEADRRPDGAAGDAIFGGDDDEAGGMIQQAKAAAKSKKDQKTAKEAAREQAKLLRQNRPEAEVEHRRKTSKRILQNRGLVRARKESAGNSRVTNRKKYETKIKKRKGAVLEMRQGADDGATYAGEATGVRTHVKKSMKLG
eukprot:CAMPEP_0203859604 /NCGR_PEP_ID=MMETSP0359-20131031/11944_1 /ASSEMBLY_ACC=CAM_ASM_000338 /TAXON_ID=268821 /ORGANISM="Scrippsiella Hangoei, Strain SHTV-5" /LENGTH=652 /DNA_ID=CAMNT_0050776551 /DNA_START=50 /DNA_END=2008 /DNA_ORIENTATION=+